MGVSTIHELCASQPKRTPRGTYKLYDMYIICMHILCFLTSFISQNRRGCLHSLIYATVHCALAQISREQLLSWERSKEERRRRERKRRKKKRKRERKKDGEKGIDLGDRSHASNPHAAFIHRVNRNNRQIQIALFPHSMSHQKGQHS